MHQDRYYRLCLRFLALMARGLLPEPAAYEREEADITFQVCHRTKMTPGLWATLPPVDREPWLEEVIRQLLAEGYDKELIEDEDANRGEARRRPCQDRDHTFLKWSQEEGLTPAKIRDRWNKQRLRERIGNGEAGRDTVKKGLAAARKDLDRRPAREGNG